MRGYFFAVFLAAALSTTSGAFGDAAEQGAAELDAAMADVHNSCIGISDNLRRLQMMAGINTAVTGVGTLAAGGAVYAGWRRAQADRRRSEIEDLLNRLGDDPDGISDEELMLVLHFLAEYQAESERSQELRNALSAAEAESRRFGHWRTGLMAGNTATQIGAIVLSNRNKNEGGEIRDMVAGCLGAVQNLRPVLSQARLAGWADTNTLNTAQAMVDNCGRFSRQDAENIPNWQNVAQWTSVAGATVGAAGTVTSFIANTDNIRSDRTEDGRRTEHNLNVASNILAGAAGLASGVATGFNVATLTRISRLLSTADNCEGTL